MKVGNFLIGLYITKWVSISEYEGNSIKSVCIDIKTILMFLLCQSVKFKHIKNVV
jgi:hypothetical protein